MTTRPAAVIDTTKFRLSLQRLEERQEDLERLELSAPRWLLESVTESVIQRFETCYDCLWKVLKRHLVKRLGVADPPNSPKPIFRLANENHLLEDRVEAWIGYANARISTSHDYDGEKARAALELIPDFLDDAIALYKTLTGKRWDPNAP